MHVALTTSAHIGLLAPSLRGYNATDGGIASHFADLALSLREAGCKVTTITPAPKGGHACTTGELAGLSIIPFKTGLPRWLNRLAGLRWRFHMVATRRYNIRNAATALLAAHGRSPFTAVETSSTDALALDVMARRTRPPVVVRVSTTANQLVSYNDGRSDWHERLFQRWETRFVRAADRVITHSPEHRDEICTLWHLAPDQVPLIPHGIALPDRSELMPASTGGPVHILYVGRFEHRKGIDTLLAAIPAVLFAVPETRFTLIGWDPDDHWKKNFLRTHPELGTRVEFSGRVSDGKLRDAYRTCDLFVAPSRYESFGLIYVEAMAWGKPIIGCRTGGIPFVVRDGITGLLTPPGNVDALADTLVRLVKDPALRAKYGTAARDDADVRFSRTTLAHQSLALYQELAASRR